MKKWSKSVETIRCRNENSNFDPSSKLVNFFDGYKTTSKRRTTLMQEKKIKRR